MNMQGVQPLYTVTFYNSDTYNYFPFVLLVCVVNSFRQVITSYLNVLLRHTCYTTLQVLRLRNNFQ
jgi:hypothetical protein